MKDCKERKVLVWPCWTTSGLTSLDKTSISPIEYLDGSCSPPWMVLLVLVLSFVPSWNFRWALPLADGRGQTPGFESLPRFEISAVVHRSGVLRHAPRNLI